jgi:hypothetical protein
LWININKNAKHLFAFLRNFNFVNAIMKSLDDLNKEANAINLKIRKLLLNKNCFDEGIADKIAVVTTITTLREQLVKIQREIRERTFGENNFD